MKLYQPRFFTEHNQTELKFTSKPCKFGHCGPDGQGVRRKLGYSTQCLACIYKLPNGPFTHQFDATILEPAKYIMSEEEARKKHIQQVMEYHKRKPEKLKQWQHTFNTKPAQQASAVQRYHRTKEEKKEHRQEMQRAWYNRNKDEINAKAKVRYQKLKEERANNEIHPT